MAEKAIVRAAAVQIAPDLERGDGTVNKVLGAIDEAAEKGAKLVVFPETFVPWYPYFSFVRPPVLTGAEHIRLYENAVVVPGPVTEAVASAARRHGIVVVLGVNERDHGSLYNTQLIFDADGRLVLKRRKITPTFHERMIWGQGDGAGLVGGRHRRRARRRACLLGALQSARALCADGAARGNPCRPVSGLDGGADFRRPDRGDDPPPRARERLLRRQRHRLADRGADRQDLARREAAQGAARRLHDRDRVAGRRASGAAAHPRGRHGHRRSRHGAHHQAQAHDGFGRPLRPARAAQLVLDDRPARPMETSAAASASPPIGSASDEADHADSHADRAADQRVAVLRSPAR